MIYTVIINLLIDKTVLFVESTKLFISNSVRVHRCVCEILQLYVPGMGLLTPFSVPVGGFLYTMIVSGEGFCSLQVVSRGFVRGSGWLWMILIPALWEHRRIR